VLSPPPAPVISPAGGTYPGSVTVALSTPALGTQLYYTTDGSEPTASSTLYAGAFNLSSNATVKVKSYLNGMASATTSADFVVTAGSAPTAAAGLALWFKADTGLITDGSGNVSQWLDESGNGNHASQTATAAEPLAVTNAINGEPAVRFNGTSDYLSFPAVNTTNFTVFIIYRMTGHQAWGGPIVNRAAGLHGFEVGSGSADTSVYMPELVESFGSQELADKTTGVGLSLPMGPTLQEWTSDARFFQDGLEQALINGATGWDVSGGRLGYAWSYMAGDIAEVLVYNTVLSDTDRQGVESYLNGKYAVLSPPPAPVISPAGGTYPGSVTVALSTPALGTQLYYTTDGSEPTASSTLYAGAFNLSSNATVKVKSYLNGMGSATTSADFVVTAGSAPTSAAGLALWFKADTGLVTDGSGNVSQWLDQSGNGNHASQTVMAAEPVLATNAINGQPVVRFNGTSDYLSFPAVNTTNFTVFIVYRMTGHQAWGGPMVNRAAGEYGFELSSGTADTSVFQPHLVESLGGQELANKTTGVGLSLPLGPTLQEWTSDYRYFEDGLEQAVINGVGGWDVSGGRLGYAWSYMSGDIAEVLVYNTVLSDTDRQGVANYLNGKYAVLSPPPAPVISPAGGTYPGSVTVTLNTPALGTQLYYTTDGSAPTSSSTLYTGAFNLSSNATVKAVSYLNGMGSATTSADFVVTAGSAPTSAAGLALWFKADTGLITDGSGNVSQWLDESGNGNHASQTVTAAEPVLATNAINGESAVRFNGTSDYLGFPAVNTTNFTVFIVYRMTGHQAWGGPLVNRAAGQYGFEVASGIADTSVYQPHLVRSLGSAELANKTTGVGLSLPLGPTLQEWTSDARFFQDGLEQTVVNGVGGWDVSGGRLGYAWSYMAGDIAEVLVYDTVLSDTDRQGVESYLNGKYFNPANTNDYYNGNLPSITITGGNNQSGLINSWLPIPLTVQLTDTNALILTNAPVTFTVTQGSALIANSNSGMTTNALQITTDTNGQAAVWLQLPSNIGTDVVTVSAQSGTNVVQVNFIETAKVASGLSVNAAVGGERIMELSTNGSVLSWGGNQFGELGDFTHLDNTNPVHVVGLTNIAQIASGLNHSLAIDSNGALWAWGDNQFAQLGDGDLNSTNVPVLVFGMSNSVIAVAGSHKTSVAVKSDGSVWHWGTTEVGSGSDISTVTLTTPTQVAGITNAIAVAVGEQHMLVLLSDGSVWAWGQDNFGQLGNGSFGDSSDVPVQVLGLTNIVKICAGANHNLALDANGCVWAWGRNNSGQLGDGGGEYSLALPVMVLTNIVQIAAGTAHSLAVDSQGELWAWGKDSSGQLGDGGLINQTNLPMQVLGMTNMVSVAAGSDASAAFDNEGNLWQWGSSDSDNNAFPWGDENSFPMLAPTYVDYYDGQLPGLQVLNGNNQIGHGGSEFAQPLIFQVTDTNGLALSNAPVSVEIISGDMELRTNSGGTNFKGLRLTTDTNGEVSLIGFADNNLVNTSCQIRVLAASREQLAEADFSETLVPPPTVSITSPVDGSFLLIGTNQTLTITADAEAASGFSIQEVDYYYGTNGVANIPLGVSTSSPYSFTWTNSLWWTNAFVGQYTLSAVAVDTGGGQSGPAQSATVTIALDADGNGLPDFWEMEYFSQIGLDPNSSPDGNGQSLSYDYQNGIDPTDYYDGALPTLETISGNDQSGNYNAFLPLPLTINVTNNSPVALTNAPVVFTVTNGTALLAATTNDTPVTSLTLRSDTNGNVSVWVYFPPAGSNPPDSTILASAFSGSNSVAVILNEYVPLAHWTFNDTNTWIGEGGQLPLLATNVAGVPSWSSNAVLVDSISPASLSYNVVETNGNTNINCQTGSMLFWFKPDWGSTNAGGVGPGTSGRLVEIGSYNPAFTNGWWSLYCSPDGHQLMFGTSTNGGGMTNLTANISWSAGEWYQIALTYSPTGSALYVDGQLLAAGAGVTFFPNADELTNGFRIGSDQDGNNQAGGAFDELETFNYPLDAANTYTHGSDIPDWWEVKYFNQTGMDPNSVPVGGNLTLLRDYQWGHDPNVISFTLSLTNQYVNSSTVSVPISILSGIPYFMAVMVDTNPIINGSLPNFAGATWEPYPTNVVALNFGDGSYTVWVGLRGLPSDAQQTWQVTKLILDTVPPILTITNPAVNVVSQPMIQLQGYANESLSSLTFDVSNATGIWTNQTGYITGQFCDTNSLAFTTNYFQCYDIVLTTNGDNLITLHAVDLAGNTFTTNVSFTLDYSSNTNPPVTTLTWPQDGTIVGGTNFTLQGVVSDPTATVSITITDTNGNTNVISGSVARDGNVLASNIPLGTGPNTITVMTTSASGNTSTNNLAVTPNDVGLAMNPLTSAQLNQSSVNLTGTIGDASYSVTVNGVSATISGDPVWEADYVPVSPTGTANIYIEVRDNLGNLIATQAFCQLQPALVTLMSYSKQAESYQAINNQVGLIWQSWFPQDYSWAGFNPPNWGQYGFVPIPVGPSYQMVNYGIFWNYKTGGFTRGFAYYTGNLEGGTENPYFDLLDDNLLPGLNFIDPLLGIYPLWENSDRYGILTRTHVMIQPQGDAVAGTTVSYLVQAQAWDYSTYEFGQQLPSDSLSIQGTTLFPATNTDGSAWGVTILQAPAGANVDVTPIAQDPNDIFNVQAVQLDLLAVDNNRDGQITFDQPGQINPDDTTPAKPYRFWINDSKESGDIASGADDQIPGSSPANYSWNHPQGRSDYVNFFPVALCLSNVLQLMPTTDGYEYRLYQAAGAVKFLYTDLTPTNAFDYLTNSTGSADYGSIAGYDPSFSSDSSGAVTYTTLDAADVVQVPVADSGVVLNTNWLAQVQANGGKGVILAEGCAATTQPLWLEIWHNGKIVGGQPLYLSINGVEQMFRHLNLRDGGDAPANLPGPAYSGDVGVISRMGKPSNFPDDLLTGSNKWLFFIHGYNVSAQESLGWEAEMFKRFYWGGNQTKFVGVDWLGNPAGANFLAEHPVFGLADYYLAEMNAFATAPQLAAKINALAGSKTIVGHSLGCELTAFALSDFGLQVNNACLMDAAFAQECFDDNADVNLTAMQPSAWSGYPEGLFAANWHQRFDSSDARSTLTWCNRFTNALSNANVYSFYSSTEDVLGEYDGEPNSAIIQDGWAALTSWNKSPLGIYAWVIQEKTKGNIVSYGIEVQGSDYGGWGFNVCDGYLTTYPTWYAIDGTTGDRRVKTPSEIGTVTQDLLDSSRYNSLFKNGWGTWNESCPTCINVNTDASLYTGPSWIQGLFTTPGGSTLAADPAKNTQLLAQAIPALSLPVGANPCQNRLLSEKQFNMPVSFTDSSYWPSDRGIKLDSGTPNWHHNDISQVAYPYLYRLFNQLVSISNQ